MVIQNQVKKIRQEPDGRVTYRLGPAPRKKLTAEDDKTPLERKYCTLIEIVNGLLENQFEGNTTRMVKKAGLKPKRIGNVRHYLSDFDTYGVVTQFSRIKRTSSEGKTAQGVKEVLAQFVEDGDLFPKFSIFREMVQNKVGMSASRPKIVKEALAQFGVSVKVAKNVACVFDEESRNNRARNADYFCQEAKRIGIDQKVPPFTTPYNEPVLLFMDECSINQADLDNLECLSPLGIPPFHKHAHSVTTESVSLMLVVDQWGQVVHYKLRNTTQAGSHKYNDVVDFFEEALILPAMKNFRGEKNLYLDNAACHKKAFKPRDQFKASDPNKPTEEMFKKMENIQKKFKILWAPAYTPESNLAEYCFRSLKSSIIKHLNNQYYKQKGPEWTRTIISVVQIWILEQKISSTTTQHIVQFMKDLVKCGGDLQEEMAKRRNFGSLDEVRTTLKFLIK